MTKSIYRFLVLVLLAPAAFAQPGQHYYTINGTVHGFANGTKLYLSDLTDGSYNHQLDSAIIQHGRFTIKGSIRKPYLLVAISTTNFEYRVQYWLQGGWTSFEADKEHFNKAVIVGATIQRDFAQLNALRENTDNSSSIDYHFIKDHPASIISAYTLSSYCNSWGKDTLKALYQSFSNTVKASTYAQKVKDFISLNRAIKVGESFVDIAQQDTAGKTIRLSSLKGKVVLLEFWGSWCGPCREENPVLAGIYSELKDKGFEIFGVAAETNKQQWIKAICADSLTWINVTDFKGDGNKAVVTYGVSGFPTNFLIDRNGIIIAKDIYGDELKSAILKAL